MRLYSVEKNGYIASVGTGYGGTEITDKRYNDIMAVLADPPRRTETTGWKLRTDLTWEPFEIVLVPDPDPEPTIEDKAEAYDILMGVSK